MSVVPGIDDVDLDQIIEKTNDMMLAMNAVLGQNPLSIDASFKVLGLAFWLVVLNTDAAKEDRGFAIRHASKILGNTLGAAQMMIETDCLKDVVTQ